MKLKLKHIVFALVFWGSLVMAAPMHLLGDVPFPWGTEIAFPWGQITGIWQGNFNGGISYYYSFRVIGDPDVLGSEPVVEVVQLTPDLQSVWAVGDGVATLNGKLVEAVMDHNHRKFLVIVRAYRVENSLYTVLTEKKLTGKDDGMSAILSKVGYKPVQLQDCPSI